MRSWGSNVLPQRRYVCIYHHIYIIHIYIYIYIYIYIIGKTFLSFWSIHSAGTFFLVRRVILSYPFNDANDSSHCQLFVSAIRFEKYVSLKTLHGYSVTDLVNMVRLVSLGPEPEIHVTSFAEMKCFSKSDYRFEQLTLRSVVCTIKSGEVS